MTDNPSSRSERRRAEIEARTVQHAPAQDPEYAARLTLATAHLDDDWDETTAKRHARNAAETLETAEHDTLVSEAAVNDWRSALGFFRDLYDKNGFGEDIMKVWRGAPGRRAS